MIKVDLIFSTWKTAPTGASHFVSRMEENKPLFLQCGIDLRVISKDLFDPRFFSNATIKEKKWKKLAKWIARHSALLTRLVIYRGTEKTSKQIVRYYESLADKGDVLAFQEFLPCYYYLKLHKGENKKVLLTLHTNGDIWKMWSYSYPKLLSSFFKSYRNRIEKTLFSGCYKIGFVADYPRQYFCKTYSFEEDKTYFVYTAIEEGKEPIKMEVGNKVKFITSGTLGERKNQMGVLNAISLLPEETQRQIIYIILSNGDMRDELEKKAKTLFAEVIFAGKVEHVEDHLRKANCFILFSKDEGQPMSIVEAMRIGLPIIGSNIAGIPEQIIDGETGYVVDLDEMKLAEKIRYIVDHKEILPGMGQASYSLFKKKFTIDAMIKRYAEIYKN